MASRDAAAPLPAAPEVKVEDRVRPAPSGAAEPPRKKLALLAHRRFRRALVYVALALLALSAVWWFRFRPFVSSEDARVAAPVVVVAPRAIARVERVLVREGQEVPAGEVLVELDDSAERAQVDRARAALTLAEASTGAAEAQLSLERRLVDAAERRARAGVRSAQAAHRRTVTGARPEEIVEARADVASAEAVAERTAGELARAEALSQSGALTERDLEAARTAAAVARSALDGRRAALELLEHGARPEDVSIAQGAVVQAEASLSEADAGSERIALRTRQLEEARARVAQARADLALAEVALDRMTLRSPVGGTVVRVAVDPGDHLSPGQGAVTIVDLEHAWIAANVEETETGLLRPGQRVQISVDEGGELGGELEVVGRSAASQFALIPAENAAGNFTKVVQRIPVRISVDDATRGSSLRVGQSVVIRIRVR